MARPGAAIAGDPHLAVVGGFDAAPDETGHQQARDVVRACLETLTILPVDHAILTAAFALGGSDFEDDVQIAAAQAHGLDAIVTRDTGGFRDSPMPIFSPAQLIARLSP